DALVDGARDAAVAGHDGTGDAAGRVGPAARRVAGLGPVAKLPVRARGVLGGVRARVGVVPRHDALVLGTREAVGAHRCRRGHLAGVRAVVASLDAVARVAIIAVVVVGTGRLRDAALARVGVVGGAAHGGALIAVRVVRGADATIVVGRGF